jgi:ketopantoate reductase
MGIITGYHLALSGAKVTFLIRPDRKEALDQPQILY